MLILGTFTEDESHAVVIVAKTQRPNPDLV